jgi:hypothetical protein
MPGIGEPRYVVIDSSLVADGLLTFPHVPRLSATILGTPGRREECQEGPLSIQDRALDY